MTELLTVSEVARILRVDGSTVRRWVKIGVLEAVVLPHVGKRQISRISRETVNKILDSHDMDQFQTKESEDVGLAEAVSMIVPAR